MNSPHLKTIFKIFTAAFFAVQLLALPVFAVEFPSDKGLVAKSTVSDILDSLVNATYFKDEYFNAPSTAVNKFGFPSNFVPQYSDSTYAARIATLNSKTPIGFVYNNQVKGFIRAYAVERRSTTAKMLGLSKIYFPLFEEKLDGANVPLEMKYLAIVESGLNPTAISPAGAKGLWQFMYGTGKMYGLESTSFVEDRYDPYKATVAASRHLKDLYNIYGDWLLALAAYNCGPGNVNKAIRKAGGVKDYWVIWDYLPAETRGYVPAFIAVNYIMSYYHEHNIRPVEPGYLYHDTDTLRISRSLAFDQLTETIGVPAGDLQFLNPQYKLGIIPPAVGAANILRIPKKYVAPFQQREKEIYAYKSTKTLEREELLARMTNQRDVSVAQNTDNKAEKTHVVVDGETLGSIARLYRVYISQLIAWNNLKDPDVAPGQKLIVFGGAEKEVVVSSEPSVKKVIQRHKVRRKETLFSIAKQYGMTVERLAALNKFGNKKSLVAGSRIKVEKTITVKEKRSLSKKKTYKVKKSKAKKSKRAGSSRKRRK